MVKLNLHDIIAVEASSNYCQIHTANKIYVPYRSISSMEKELSADANFRRINRSMIINTHYIEAIGGYQILLKTGLIVSVGISYQRDFDVYFQHHIKSINSINE